MKTYFTCLLTAVIFLSACNTENKPGNAETSATQKNTTDYPYVKAKVNGKAWNAVKDEILATYSEIDDKLQIFTKDADGKMNFLLTLAPFSKTGVGEYNSIREGTAGYGISLLDENAKDDVVLDYDNFRQGAVANCLYIVSVKETAEGKIVEGGFASMLNISNNYEASKEKLEVTDGRFAVLLKK
ncbi:hypothetical protein [Ferruginibacter sp.]|nr:hypothetical protein [Ferruginibacter sp.]